MRIMNLLYYVHCTFDSFDIHIHNITVSISFFSFAKEFGYPDWQGYGLFIHRWTRGTALSTRQYVVVRSQPPPMMNWRPGRKWFFFPPWPGTHQTTFTMVMKLPFYKSLPHRTYCFDGDKPAGFAKCKDRLTLLIITNMDGSDHRKLSVIGKSKTSHCLHKKYKMQVKDMSVDWYASKNAWMTGEIHHQIMSKLNNEMRLSNRHILYVCDNASSHQVREYSHIKFLMLPPKNGVPKATQCLYRHS